MLLYHTPRFPPNHQISPARAVSWCPPGTFGSEVLK
jgi:hypothetical protein